MTYSEMKNNRKALERENTSVKFEKPMTYSEMKPINNIMNGKDTLFNDIMSFGKSAMGDNPFSGYYKQGYKSPDDYNSASNYLLSSIDSLKGFKDRLNKNRAAYERVYGADTVKKQEENLDQMLSLYNSQDLWDDIEGRRDAFAQYKDADEYYTLNDDEGNPFSEKYNGYDYKGIGLAINALASKEYALSDSQKRELKWLRDNQISFANDEELENALALAKGQAENARTESDRLHRVESDNRAIGSPEDSSDAYEHDPYKKEQKSAANETAAKYEAQAATLQNYYDERKENERIAAIEQQVHEKYMPLLNDEEFAKHTGFERDKYVAYDPSHSPSPQSGYADSVYASQTRDGFDEGENQFTPDEFKVFNGLWNTQGEEAAQEFLDELRPVLDKRITDAENARLRKNTREHPYIGSFAAVMNNLVSGLATVDDVFAKINGKEINPYSSAHSFGNNAQVIRGTTSQMLEDELRKNPGSFWNNKSALFGRDEDGNPRAFGLFAKETTESMIDNLARIAVSKGVGMAVGGNAGISEAALKTIDFTLMGSQVAAQTIVDAKKRGLSDGKALAMGFTSGAIEAITEVWSIEKVLGNPKSFVKTLGKSLLAEGSEEISSNILNRAVDVLINSDQSEVMQEYYGYINEGLSPSEASAKTLTGIIGDDLSAGLGGALSGVMMSGTNYRLSQAVEQSRNIRNGIRQIKVGRELKSADSVITALDEIIAANPENKEAITAKEAIENGENVSARRLGKLFSDEFTTQYNKTVTPVDSAEVKAKLEQNGVKNAETLSKTIAKAFNEGYDSVKGQERTELTHNAEAMKIYNEYLTERENAAKNSDRLFRTYSNVDRSELISYAKEQGKNNSFIREASDLAEGKTDLDSLDNLQEAVFTEITDKFLSADTVEEAQNVYKELSQGAGKGIKSLLDTALDNRTEEITAANSYDKIADVSFKKTRDGVAAYIVTEKMAEEAKAAKAAGKKTETVPISLFDANIGSETTAVIDRATAKPAEARTIYAKEYVDGNRYLAAASYDRAFNKYYEAGKRGMSFSDIKRSSRDIKADSARRIYEAGRRATENESKRQSKYKQSTEYKNRSKERTEQNAAAKKQGGVVREYSASKKVSRQQRQQLRLLDVWAKEKGVVIRVVDSLADKIKLEGKVINGRYNGGNVITIALDGRNMLTSTAGHELYHMIQRLSPEYAKSFSEFVINHLKEAGKYDSVFRDYERRYGKTYARDENFKAKIDEEIVADHCFEALTNKEQWESFAAENKTIADKIKDFIKEFVAMINRAFDKYFVHDNAEIRNEVMGEVDYMNEIARRLSEGVDEAVENYRFGAGTEGETKFSIGEIVDDDGNKYGIGVVLDSNLLDGLTQNERKQMVKERVVDELAGQQIIAYDKNGNAVEINFAEKGDKIKNKNGKNASVLKELYHKNIDKSIKQEAVVLADELIKSANYQNSKPSKYPHDWLDNNGKNKWEYWDVYIQDKNKTVYVATLNVANTQNGNKILYDIDPIKKARGPIKSGPTLTNTNISQNDTDVNTHSMQKSKNNSSFSISDSNGNQLSENQQKYFADSKVRDENGNLKVMYRGGNNTDTVFRRENTHGLNLYGRGFYFTDSESHAKQYGTATEYYLKIDNPLSTEDHKITKAQLRNFIDTVANDEEYGIDNYGQGATVDSVFNSVWGKDDFSMIQDINATAIGDMVEATKIFNAVNRTNYDGFILGTETVIFNSEQAKLTDNQNPTDNPDVRYSVSESSVSDADYLAAAESGDEKTAAEMVRKAAEEAFKDSVVRDDNGNLLKVYHGRVSKFNVFDREFANIEGDMGKGFYFSSQKDDVDSNYANNEGPDLTNKIARLAERIEAEQDIDYDEAEKKAREHYIKSEPNTVEAYLNVKNPAIISNDNDGTYLEYNENYDEETDDYGDPEGSLVDFVEALESAAEDYESFRPVNFWEALGDGIYDGGISLKDAIPLLKKNIIDELSDENGDLAINEVIRQAIEDIGFDGIIDKTVSEKFPNMQGMYSDTTHYIVFDSSQIKSADPITYDDSGNIIPLSERFNSSEKDIRYSISKKFYDDFDKWDGKNPSITFEIGNTSDALQSIGIKNQKIIMHSGMILNKLNKHSELSRDIFRQIPELLERPVIVQFSDAIDPKTGKQKYDSSITVLGELYTEKESNGRKANNPVLVSIKLLPQNKKSTKLLNVSVITSAYAKSNLQRYINKNSILYIDPDKKRTNKWLSLNRLQLPVGENRLGSIRRITYIGGKVKIENSKNSSPMQAALEKAGIVNSSGISLLNNSENDTDFSEKILSDDQRASISDAGMRLTDNAELSSLMRENADYKAEIERLKGEFVKSKRMGGKGKNRLMQADINRIAREIISEYSSEISFYDLKDELTGFYEFLANADVESSGDYAFIVKTANDIAKSVIAQSFTDITPEEFADYKKALRGYRLIPNLEDVAELEQMFGTFGAAYRQYGKKLNMRAKGTPGALHIDEVWEELCEAVPLLDRNADSTQEMWRNLIEVRDSLDEKTGFNPYLDGGEFSAGQTAAVLGADILERFNEISPDTTFADRAQQRVNIREQKISELKADKQEALKKLREQRDTKISELKESFRQQNQKRRERSSRTALRHKIKALTADMNRRLLYPKKNEYIPRELMSSVAGVLNAINLDSGKSAALSQKFSVLKSAYEAIQKSEKYQSAYDSTVADMIQNLVEKSSGKFTAVSKENLEYIYDTLKAVDKLCKDAIKVKIAGEEHDAKEFSKQLIKETRQAKDMGRLSQKYTFAQSRPEAVFERFGGFAKNSAWQKMYTLLNDGQLKKTAILIEGKRMFNELVEGKNKKNVDNLISVNEKDLVDIGLVDSDGNSVKITRDMMNAVYMMLENEDNTRHLIYGGLTVPDLKGYYKGKNEAFGKGAVRAEIMQGKFVDEIHRIREQIETAKDSNAADKAEQLDELYEKRDLLVAQAYSKAAEIKNKIAEQMTDYDRAWIAKAKEFFDGFSRDQMNAVTLMVYGFEKARIENYFPIHTDSAFRNEDFGVIQKAASLENMGFTKERVFSGKPIMLEGLTDVINGHIDDIANYAGLMPSVREFQKVYGKNMTDENGLTSVQNALREKFGTQGRKYISDLLGDITGSRQRSGSAFFNRVRGNMAQATLSVNARVALSQAASYPTAAAEIGWKPLTKALGMGLKKADKTLIAEYSPLLAYRMAGYSNPEIGNIKDLGKTQNKVLKNTAWLMNWITQIDGATVGRLWYASQFYVDDNNSQLKAAFDKATAEHKANTISDEQFQKAKDDYYSEVAKVFNRVVERTQPNYTTMQRPAVLRSDKDLIRSMTMFYTQRLQNVSILYDAFSRMRSYSESYKNNPSGDVTAEDVKTARNEFGRAVFSQIVATTTLTAMKTIVDILLQSLYAYRDPDDDITPESFWGNVGYNFLDSFVSNLLFGSEMLKIAKAAYQIYDGSFSSRNADDFITIGGVETINDFTVYLEKFGDSFSKYVNGEGDLEDLGKSGLNLAKITGTLTGVPVANIGKLVEGIVSLGDKIAEGESLLSSGENQKTGTSSKKNMDKYNAAYAKADSSAAKEAVRTMIEEEKQKLLENGADQYAVNSKGQNKVTLEAKQNVRNKFSNEYRDKYKQAYRNKDTKTVAEIKTKLSFTGLYDNLDDTLEKWRDSADEEVKKEKRAKEYAEKNK